VYAYDIRVDVVYLIGMRSAGGEKEKDWGLGGGQQIGTNDVSTTESIGIVWPCLCHEHEHEPWITPQKKSIDPY